MYNSQLTIVTGAARINWISLMAGAVLFACGYGGAVSMDPATLANAYLSVSGNNFYDELSFLFSLMMIVGSSVVLLVVADDPRF